MRRRAAIAALLLAFALPGAAGAAVFPFVPANSHNYAHAHRRPSAIRMIVIHAVEGSYGGAISWFQNAAAEASANYVVSRDGAVTEMVPWWDIAWHAGNGWVNAHSLGIEHEGFTNTAWTFTDAEYRASAQLVAQLAHRFRIPLDRRHVIGHSEVPDPFHPGLFGGFAHHTDPGHYWDWKRFMSYARAYAAGLVPPPPAFDVTIPSLEVGATVSGVLPWQALTTGAPAADVEFLIDGKVVATSTTAPYALSVETSTLANGTHALGVHAVATDGAVADATVVVKIANAPPKITSFTVTNGEAVTGAVPLTATTRGRVLQLQFLVDGAVTSTLTQAPYTWSWDTTSATAGPHTLTVRAIGGRTTATRTVTVDVAH